MGLPPNESKACQRLGGEGAARSGSGEGAPRSGSEKSALRLGGGESISVYDTRAIQLRLDVRVLQAQDSCLGLMNPLDLDSFAGRTPNG